MRDPGALVPLLCGLVIARGRSGAGLLEGGAVLPRFGGFGGFGGACGGEDEVGRQCVTLVLWCPGSAGLCGLVTARDEVGRQCVTLVPWCPTSWGSRGSRARRGWLRSADGVPEVCRSGKCSAWASRSNQQRLGVDCGALRNRSSWGKHHRC